MSDNLTRNVVNALVLVTSLAPAGFVLADGAVNDPLYIAGDYKCTGFDSHDGAFKGDLSFKVDEKSSHFSQNFGAYTFKLEVDLGSDKAIYTGYAAAQGQQLAMYFANDSLEAATDRGVGLAPSPGTRTARGNTPPRCTSPITCLTTMAAAEARKSALKPRKHEIEKAPGVVRGFLVRRGYQL